LSQDAYANEVVDILGLSEAVVSLLMTMYWSGLPIDTIPEVEVSESDHAPLISCKVSHLDGNAYCLAISTCADIATEHPHGIISEQTTSRSFGCCVTHWLLFEGNSIS